MPFYTVKAHFETSSTIIDMYCASPEEAMAEVASYAGVKYVCLMADPHPLNDALASAYEHRRAWARWRAILNKITRNRHYHYDDPQKQPLLKLAQFASQMMAHHNNQFHRHAGR